MEKERGIIIVGSGNDAGLLALKIAELKLAHPSCEIVTIEEAKERGLTETYKITPPPKLPALCEKLDFYSDGKSARNIRRENKRKSKKR